MVETLKTHKQLKDLEGANDDSLAYQLFSHKAMQKDPETVFVPYLKLLGILYCASTKKMKAQSLFAVIKQKGSGRVPLTNQRFSEYIQKIVFISYFMAFDVYHKNSDVEVESSFAPELTEDELDLIGKKIF